MAYLTEKQARRFKKRYDPTIANGHAKGGGKGRREKGEMKGRHRTSEPALLKTNLTGEHAIEVSTFVSVWQKQLVNDNLSIGVVEYLKLKI